LFLNICFGCEFKKNEISAVYRKITLGFHQFLYYSRDFGIFKNNLIIAELGKVLC
jgi:hypothetical protein